MQEPTAARAPRQFVRMKGGPTINKVVHIYNQLLYLLAIRLGIDDMAPSYSQQPAILFYLLL